MSKVYYNEIDPYCVAWLKNLMADGHIAGGDIDDRPIQEVRADDVRGYERCHFFAGIGGWELALRLAEPLLAAGSLVYPACGVLWTGSPPCQPFSSAGQRKGAADNRHLWPAFFALIAECRPTTVFGEQVAGKLGIEWFQAVRLDLESVGYSCGAADLPAAGIGAPHKRQRVYWLGHERPIGQIQEGPAPPRRGNLVELDDSAFKRSKQPGEEFHRLPGIGGTSKVDGGVGHADGPEKARQRQVRIQVESKQETGRPGYANPWAEIVFIQCADGKSRPIKPGILPLADGFPGRVGQIRAYGNAIVPQVAAVFIKSFMEIDS